jgi:hypothetical protein
MCGGSDRLNIYSYTTSDTGPSEGTAVWSSLGCYTDVVGARTLPLLETVEGGGQTLTIEKCTAACQADGFTYAGVEFAQECYCGNTLQNGGKPAPDGDRFCNMACTGDDDEVCGGPNRLNLFKFEVPPSTTSTSSSTTTTSTPTCTPDTVHPSPDSSTVCGKQIDASQLRISFSNDSPTFEDCQRQCDSDKRCLSFFFSQAQQYCAGFISVMASLNPPASASSGYVAYDKACFFVACDASSPATTSTTSSSTTSTSTTSLPASCVSSTASSLASAPPAAAKCNIGFTFTGQGYVSSSISTSPDDCYKQCIAFVTAHGYTACLGVIFLTVNKGCGYVATASGRNSIVSAANEPNVYRYYDADCWTNGCADVPAVVSTTTSSSSSSSSTTSSSTSSSTSTAPTAAWTSLGCYTDTLASRTLRIPIPVTGGPDTVTIESCQTACGAAGFTYAGVEYARECYCDNSIQATGTLAKIQTSCFMACSGNANEICGGPDRVNIYQVTAPQSYGWSDAVCVTDSVGARTLANQVVVEGGVEAMTVEACQSRCRELGYTIAGVEFARECYCDFEFRNGAGKADDPQSCNMPCAGDETEICGGADRLSTYTFGPKVEGPIRKVEVVEG